MLKSWLLQNFKPILDSGELPLAPVTVLAGRNSSGKSSLIQSILMISQTLSSRVLDRALLPNGPIVQLGTFEDILSEQTKLRTIKVGFELELGKEELRAATSTRSGSVRRATRANIKSVKVVAEFRSGSNDGESTSAIEASKVEVDRVSLDVVVVPVSTLDQLTLSPETAISDVDISEPEIEFALNIERLMPSELSDFLKDVSPESQRLVPYNAKDPNYLGLLRLKNELRDVRIPEPSLISFSHFMPTRLIGRYIVEERRKLQAVSVLSTVFDLPVSYFKEFFENNKGFSEIFSLKTTITPDLVQEIHNIFHEENIKEEFSGQTLLDLILWYKNLKINRKKKVIVDKKIQEFIVQNIMNDAQQIRKEDNKGIEALEVVTNNVYIENLEVAVGRITRFFTSKIRYLGPLRADPQASQRFSPSSELDDVGTKGEYAAAVYDANQNAFIRYYNPSREKIEESTLKVALDNWVRYLGVANEVLIQEAGQSGVSWQVVHKQGHKALPLTAVGVGVSQILPILVMGLLAPEDTLLLVEQPELHLHPSVQARLGDFFIGLSQCNKQCLIETHSENLVSQIRYHIVQAGGLEKSNCLVYFVDQDDQGAARFNPIEISAQGNILNWPDGFFDETMLQEDRITAAGLKKRAKKGKE